MWTTCTPETPTLMEPIFFFIWERASNFCNCYQITTVWTEACVALSVLRLGYEPLIFQTEGECHNHWAIEAQCSRGIKFCLLMHFNNSISYIITFSQNSADQNTWYDIQVHTSQETLSSGTENLATSEPRYGDIRDLKWQLIPRSNISRTLARSSPALISNRLFSEKLNIFL